MPAIRVRLLAAPPRWRSASMEAVFGAMGQAIPERLFAAPAGTSGNFGLGGYVGDATAQRLGSQGALR